ncbi:MAG: hypothetical protein DRO16_03650 [Thermoprotei archaeon]|nr:MAG: hypothetical protein DRO16_03650 [Thermoprotei archaeon]
MLKIKVETIIKPTEDPVKVRKAVENVFTGEILVTNIGDGYKKVEGFSTRLESLSALYNLIRIEQIIPAARSYLLKGTKGNTIRFMIHKQAAYMRKISFVDSDRESPLGAIKFTIESQDPMRIIDWLTPTKYKHGE